jgi:L-threonylcarbamoyladenylate synthase
LLILNNTDRDLARAADLLRAGELVAFGTETVYGLGADAADAQAVAAISRPRGGRISAHLPLRHRG